LDIVVTLGHNLCKDLAGFISGVGCQVFHGIVEYLMLVSLGAWLCGCPGTGCSFCSVVLRFPLHPMLDRLTHFHHWLVFLVACLVYM
jgi:hypothetical protein